MQLPKFRAMCMERMSILNLAWLMGHVQVQMLYWEPCQNQTLDSCFQTVTQSGRGRHPTSLSRKR